jgi:hypothetical protein
VAAMRVDAPTAWAMEACCCTARPRVPLENRPARRPPLPGDAPMCNMNRPGSVKEFAQCFRAQAVGPTRAANTVSYKETNHIVQGDKPWEAQTSGSLHCRQHLLSLLSRRKTVAQDSAARDAAIAKCVKEAQTAYPLDGDDQGRNRTALYKACMTAAKSITRARGCACMDGANAPSA